MAASSSKSKFDKQIGVGTFRATERMKRLVMDVLASGRLTAGPMMDRFERKFADLHASRFALMCNSGTSALQIALAALKERGGWSDGDEVLVPAVTFVASSNVVLYNGLKPAFVEVEADYFEIDPKRIEEQITPRTRAIMPVHLAGHPCDMDPILEIAKKHDLRVVEDSCETMFARYRGRPVGSFGDVGCFSTYVAHVVTTGVGGLCTTSDEELLALLKSLMNHGRDSIYIRIDDDREADDIFQIADRRFSFVRFGHSYRCTELEAALGVAQLEVWEEQVASRRRVAAGLSEALSGLSALQLPSARPDTEHVYMFYPIVVTDPTVRRSDLIRHLEERGVETRYLLPLINQPVYRERYGNLDDEFPVAASLNENAFYIGCHPDIGDAEIEYIGDCFRAFFN